MEPAQAGVQHGADSTLQLRCSRCQHLQRCEAPRLLRKTLLALAQTCWQEEDCPSLFTRFCYKLHAYVKTHNAHNLKSHLNLMWRRRSQNTGLRCGCTRAGICALYILSGHYSGGFNSGGEPNKTGGLRCAGGGTGGHGAQ